MILSLLIATAALTRSQMPIRLNGSEGLAILNSLTEGQLNQSNESINATNNAATSEMTREIFSNFGSW